MRSTEVGLQQLLAILYVLEGVQGVELGRLLVLGGQAIHIDLRLHQEVAGALLLLIKESLQLLDGLITINRSIFYVWHKNGTCSLLIYFVPLIIDQF